VCVCVCVWCTEQYTNYICMTKGYHQLRLSW